MLKFLEFDFGLPTTNPTISYLLNEVSGSFSPFTLAPQFDPPSIYGQTLAPTSYNPLRYYFSGTGNLARCIHMQVKVDFGTASTADECINMSINGALVKGR
jgi:hypothetical protein